MVNWQRGVMRLMRITNHKVAVTQVEDFTDYYRRIHFTGPELLAELSEVFPTLWTRLWFPHPDKGEGQVSQRGYTFVDIDLATGAFSLDFVIHGDEANSDGAGPASRWAARATPGTTIEAALTPARIDLPADTNHILLAGDLTALPAVNSWLEAIPAEVAVTVTIEDDRAPEAATSLPRASHPNARWKWNLRDGAYGHALADHVRSLGLDADGLYVWAAGERGLIKQIRTVVKQDLGLKKDHYFSQFYWFDGKPTG
ncbi:siderophore-interacting protein [Brevibacterium sp. UCMA 11752]|uniref:siderophore-interacting protein n=1 Tax=Brevibacterium sp. UCMA 11752 TaxID=2745946 RepID=UPI001F1E4F8E|nr:siderophore-interacting protein [Brevibacterium sp. UCMA 11752]MCF2586859.1 siderophore-interacting protein [Brevibacterium sp. UCMA 11752]